MKEQAEKLAANGYVALAVDLYEGKVAVDPSEARKSEARKPKRRLRLTRYYFGAGNRTSMTETVKTFAQHGDQFFPLPHPSWRSGIWMQRNPWFEEAVIPELRNAVRKLV